MAKRPTLNEVLHKAPRVIITRTGYGQGVTVRICTRDGWEIPREWATRERGAAAHADLAKRRPWEGPQHLDAARLLSGRR